MKKFTVELLEPEIVAGKEITSLEFREPKGADMEEFLGEMISDGSGINIGKSITGLASRCVVSHSLSEDDIRAFSAKNYMSISKGFMGFLS